MSDAIEVEFELQGWSLMFVLLARTGTADKELSTLRGDSVHRARRRLEVSTLAADPTVAALRRLFRAAGCDPSRYRPSSEALLRRVLKGADLPAINPLVDLNNCLSLGLAVPCCVMAEETVCPPYVLRAGRPGESYLSLKGPFNLEGKPVLVDSHGPCDAPITGSQRVRIEPGTQNAWLVAYLPRAVLEPATALAELQELLVAAPVARTLADWFT